MEFTNVTGDISSGEFGISRAFGEYSHDGKIYDIDACRRAHTNFDGELSFSLTVNLYLGGKLEARRYRYEEQRDKSWYKEEDWSGDLVTDEWEGPWVLNENVDWVEKVFDAFLSIVSGKE